MAKHTIHSLLVLSLAALIACSAEDDAPSSSQDELSSRFLIVDVTVIDGTGVQPIAGQNVLIEGDRIITVSDTSNVDIEGATIVEGTGKYLMPSLWDAHAHTFADKNVLNMYLVNGVGNLRDMGCNPECTARLITHRDLLRQGNGIGPDILVTGQNVDGTSVFPDYDGHIWVTEETAASIVENLHANGSDIIKVRDWLTLEEYDAVTAAAREAGLPVDGHVGLAIPALHALASGQRTIEHGGNNLGGLLIDISSKEDALRAELLDLMATALEGGPPYTLFIRANSAEFLELLLGSIDEQKAEALTEAFVASGTALVPTLLTQHPSLGSADPIFDGKRVADDPAMEVVPQEIFKLWQSESGSPLSEAYMELWGRQYQAFTQLVNRLHNAGVPIIAGTDASIGGEGAWLFVPGFSIHNELILLVEAGLTPLEAIAAATSVPAEVFNLTDGGSIAPGMFADLVLLNEDPTEDIRNTRKIEAVFSRGKYLDRDQLDGILQSIIESAGN